MKKKDEIKIISRNKKASHDYFILETLEVGIVLTGTEIKSIREGKTSIDDAYVEAKSQTLKIINMHISPYKQGNIFNHDEIRERVLLAHKKEIIKLETKVKLESITIVPLQLYLKKGIAKLEIAICKGKKNYDKRESLKEQSIKRDMEKYNA
ncbi:MAG: SsrA-binding protein SmpB [Bacilli bacterium]|nr:SsrA-binding protein SmpB [Bacilli bacterium]